MQIQMEELHRREEDLMRRAEELQLDLVCAIGEPHHDLSIPESLITYEQTDLEEAVEV